MTRLDQANEEAILKEASAIANRMSSAATGRPTHLVFLALLALVQVAIDMADDPDAYAALTLQVQATLARQMSREIVARRHVASETVH